MVLRLAFMGTPDFAVPTLGELVAQGHEVVCVYSQPARQRGRGLAEQPSAVSSFCAAHQLQLRTPLSLKSQEEQTAFAALNLDVAIVVAYGLLLPSPILQAPRLGCLNLHASLLPRWRGAAPIQRAIMAGDEETGVMVMQMDEGLDTGPVLTAERVTIARKTSGELMEELARLGADLMIRTLSALERGSIVAKPQSGEGVSYAKKISKEEARIDWSQSATQIDRLVRGLSPQPGAFTQIHGERVKVLNSEPVSGQGAPAEVIDADFTIACGSGALRLTKVQRAGKSVVSGREFLRGFGLAVGTRIG